MCKVGEWMITLENVRKEYKHKAGSITAIKKLDLQIDSKEIFGIIGYSGAGKSTLIRLLNGLEQPTAGSIVVAGHPIPTLNGKRLRHARQEISMIFQHFNLLWSRNVRENIAFPLEIKGVPKKERLSRVNELIKLVGLEGREDAYPSQLSGGQKQRVGIARALANHPKVLLCDEATSALDPQTTDSILDLLVDINRRLGLTIVLITHEMHVIRKICHRVAVIENGVIVEQGKVSDVFKRPQQEITKRFVQQITEQNESVDAISHLLKCNTGRVIKLTFQRAPIERPLINDLIRSYQVEMNILQGNITQTQEGAFGTLFIHLNGSEHELESALEFIFQQQVDVEVMTSG